MTAREPRRPPTQGWLECLGTGGWLRPESPAGLRRNDRLGSVGIRIRGFKTLKTAYATIKGFEVMRALRKGQASAFNVTSYIRGEARIVERAFGLGISALSEIMSILNNQFAVRVA